MDLKEYKTKIANLSVEEQKMRDLYLRDIALGNIQGPMTGYASIDKPWLKFYSKEAINAELPKMKIYDYLYEQNRNNLNDLSLNFEGFNCTYQELFDQIEETAKSFISLGVKKGDIVTICMPTLPETIYAFYALNRIGAISDMIDPRASIEQLEFYLKETKSKYILIYDECLIKIHKIYDKTNLKKVILSSASESMHNPKKFIYNHFIKKEYIKENDVKDDNIEYLHMKDFLKLSTQQEKIIDSPYEENTFALLVHSSGTTSTPKGIMLSNDNVNSLAFQYKISPLDLVRHDKFLSVIPAFAAFGMVASVHLPLSLGMENILVPKPDSKNFDKLFLKHKPNHCLTVPKNYEALKESKKIKDLSYFKSPGCGGDAPSEEIDVDNFLKEKGCPAPLLKGWGMSELSSTACLETCECAKLISNGIPLVKNTITICDQNTNEELQIGQEGEIVVTGPTMMLGYYNNETLTNKVIKMNSNNKLCLHSGDVGYLDSDGCVYVTDRIDRMIIKYDGKKIYPRTIEMAIQTNEFVESCCVVTAKSSLGKIPKAYIVLKKEFKDQSDFCLQKIQETCKKLLEERIIPDDYEIIDEMPLTAMEKINYKKLENESKNILIKKK